MKLEFADENGKWEFFKMANATLRVNNIYCKLDGPKEVRDVEYGLREEIQKLKEQNHETVYRIRNCKIQERNNMGE